MTLSDLAQFYKVDMKSVIDAAVRSRGKFREIRSGSNSDDLPLALARHIWEEMDVPHGSEEWERLCAAHPDGEHLKERRLLKKEERERRYREMFIEGTWEYMDAPDRSERVCCQNCAWLCASMGMGLIPLPYCRLLSKFITTSYTEGVFKHSCRAFEPCDRKPFMWRRKNAPANITVTGEVYTRPVPVPPHLAIRFD